MDGWVGVREIGKIPYVEYYCYWVLVEKEAGGGDPDESCGLLVHSVFIQTYVIPCDFSVKSEVDDAAALHTAGGSRNNAP
jgi:hypothetical protein